MTLNLLKLCVGVEKIEDLAEWQNGWRKKGGMDGKGGVWHTTRMTPRRRDELMDGGSLFWVIKGHILVRQSLDDVEPFTDDEGISRCHLVLHKDLVLVEPRRHRAFQGWRYLKGEEAPRDMGKFGAKGRKGELPPHLSAELRDLGLL